MRATKQVTDSAQKPLPFSTRPAVSDPHAYEPFVPGPNPKLPEFITQHATPYDPGHDDYDVPAFDRDLVFMKTNPFYTLHTYWSKKDPLSVSEYVKHYTKPGHLALDPLCGSGTTGLASLLAGCKCILVDASPSAGLLSHFYCLPAEPHEIDAAYDRIFEKVEEEIQSLFGTHCDRCNGKASIEFVVWSERYQCPNCAQVVSLFGCPEEKVPYPVGGKKA